MAENKPLMTVVIVSCDEYSDVWDNCVSLLKHFWPDCPYKILFVSQEKQHAWDGVENLSAGKNAEWSRRTLAALDACDTPYVCLLVEDFFAGAPISTAEVADTLNIMQKEQIGYFKITNFSRAVKNRDPQFKNYPFLRVIYQDDDYGISVQPAIWEKNYFKKLLGTENYNAWKFEFNRVRDAEKMPHIPHPNCVFDGRNILHIQHGLIQGKYLPGTVKYFEKLGLPLQIKRPVLSWPKYYRTRLISKAKYMVPKQWRKPVKKMLEKCGMKFVSTVRDK